MKDPNVHLRTVLAIHIGIADLLQHIQPLFHLPEDCVLAGQREDIGLGERDEEIAVVQIGTTVGSDHQAYLIDLPLHVDLVSEVGLVESALLPDGGRLFGSNLGHVVWVRGVVLFWTSAKRALL
jgi:hypothetical protein